MTIATLKYPNGYFGEFMPVEIFLLGKPDNYAVMMRNDKEGVCCRFPLLWSVASVREAIWYLQNDSRITSRVKNVKVTA
jgi:hypothetical protein